MLRRIIIRRLLASIPLVFAILISNFILVHIAPGDPAIILAGPDASPQALAQVRRNMGLDKPLLEQFAIYARNLLSGDLGYSYVRNVPVITLQLQRIPNTLVLMGSAFLISVVGGILLGVFAARRRYTKVDHLVNYITLALYSIPGFWLAIVAVVIFGLYLGLVPIQGMSRPGLTGIDYYMDVLRHLILTASVLGVHQLAIYSRLMRSSMIETMDEDYVLTARAKGVPGRDVTFRHIFPNARLPVVVVIALEARSLITGALIIETIFAWPGMGRLVFDAIGQRDFPVIMGGFFVVTVVTILFNLVADIVAVLVDPRIRYPRV